MSSSRRPQVLDIMGVPLTLFDSYEQVEECLAESIEAGDQRFCVAINPEKIYRAQQEPELMRQLNSAQLHICDGIGAALASRILHGVRPARITGVTLFMHLMKASESRHWKVFLLGASPEANQGAYEALTAKYPELQIVGHRDGYFSDSDQVVREINECGAQLLFVALGSPKQEQWIIENRERLNVAFLMGVGGSLDVASGLIKRAPGVFRKTGTEWLFRLISQPARWRRQLALPKFMLAVIKTKLLGTADTTGASS